MKTVNFYQGTKVEPEFTMFLQIKPSVGNFFKEAKITATHFIQLPNILAQKAGNSVK